MSDQQQGSQLQVKMNDDVLKGVYANALQVQHTKDEFVIDFMTLFPPNGLVSARVFATPANFKRMISALTENLNRYEQSFGKVEDAAKVPTSSASQTETGRIGFRAD
jgi:hypothetical protein